jgi:anti-sigma factor RsiW
MSDPMTPQTDHPDELLAGYVDGSAGPEERRLVEEHLATCSQCQEDVQLAAEARAALATLPQLGAPGLAEAGVLALRRAALQPVGRGEQVPGVAVAGQRPVPAMSEAPPSEADAAEPRIGRFRVGWTQLAAAAAIIVVVAGLVAIPLALSGRDQSGKGTSAAAPVPEATNSPIPPLLDRSASYTTAQLDALTGQLAATARRAHLVAGSPAVPVYAGGSRDASTSGGATLDPAAARTALQCLLSGGGVPDGAIPLYLEEADVSGTPAYVGGFFLPDTTLNIMIVAVNRGTCDFLYNVRQPA